jgi:flagellin
MERLSSGLRINSASDDAAGLSISTSVNAQVRGLNRSIQNANDWVSLFQTAEGGTQEMENMLQRMRELAVQAGNETYNDRDRASIQAEIDQLIAEVDDIGKKTHFNGLRVLDGDVISSLMQIGSNSDSGEMVSVGKVNADELGRRMRTESLFGVDTDFDLDSGADAGVRINDVEIRNTVAGDDELSTSFSANSAISKAKAINSASDSTGVKATVMSTVVGADNDVLFETLEILGGTLDGIDFFTINDQKISGFIVQEHDADGSLRDAINAVTDETGVVAELNTDGSLRLTAEDGRNIEIDIPLGGGGPLADITGLVTDVFGGRIALTSDDVMEVEFQTDDGNLSLGEIFDDAVGVDPIVFGTNTVFSVSTLDVSTAENANIAIETLDVALNQLTAVRADFGALQNRLSSTINNLTQTSENLSAAKSRILDADFAGETAQLAKT